MKLIIAVLVSASAAFADSITTPITTGWELEIFQQGTVLYENAPEAYDFIGQIQFLEQYQIPFTLNDCMLSPCYVVTQAPPPPPPPVPEAPTGSLIAGAVLVWLGVRKTVKETS